MRLGGVQAEKRQGAGEARCGCAELPGSLLKFSGLGLALALAPDAFEAINRGAIAKIPRLGGFKSQCNEFSMHLIRLVPQSDWGWFGTVAAT